MKGVSPFQYIAHQLAVDFLQSTNLSSLATFKSKIAMSQPLPQILHLPNTLEHWPWQRQINPYYEEVRAESLAWIHSFKPFNARSQYAFDKGDFS